MPISITITDISTLTKTDIQELHDYLHKVWFLTPSQNIADPNVIKQELDEEVPMPKPRKKRKAKQQLVGGYGVVVSGSAKSAQTEEFVSLDTTVTPEEVEKERIIPLPIDVLDVMAKGTEEITYDGVIAFVLENIREKKLSFDKVQALVTQFELPSLNKLDEFPHLIPPFYAALREAVDD